MIEGEDNLPSTLVTCLSSSPRQITPDAALIDRIAVGDRDAMRALFIRHNVRIFWFVLEIVKDRSLAGDVVDELFLQVWRNAHQLGRQPGLSTLLLAIARDTISAVARPKTHEKRDEARSSEDQTVSPELSADAKNRKNVLHVCATKFSPSHREILDLVYYHEEPIAAVAKIVGVPLRTATLRMSEARNHLAALVSNGDIDRSSHG
jgi:RNA polymerase sigma-70 factor, ECF subfamily